MPEPGSPEAAMQQRAAQQAAARQNHMEQVMKANKQSPDEEDGMSLFNPLSSENPTVSAEEYAMKTIKDPTLKVEDESSGWGRLDNPHEASDHEDGLRKWLRLAWDQINAKANKAEAAPSMPTGSAAQEAMPSLTKPDAFQKGVGGMDKAMANAFQNKAGQNPDMAKALSSMDSGKPKMPGMPKNAGLGSLPTGLPQAANNPAMKKMAS